MTVESPKVEKSRADGGAPDFDHLFLVRHGDDDAYRWLTPRLVARLWLVI